MELIKKSDIVIASLVKNKGVLSWVNIVNMLKEYKYTHRSAEVLLQKAYNRRILVRVSRGKYKLNEKINLH